ncbi:MAG TPA: hypothetical protein VNO74_03380 [Methylomirabilota bacterium]|nr:hypothetical protein [Methylomirabilota bacterium]
MHHEVSNYDAASRSQYYGVNSWSVRWIQHRERDARDLRGGEKRNSGDRDQQKKNRTDDPNKFASSRSKILVSIGEQILVHV